MPDPALLDQKVAPRNSITTFLQCHAVSYYVLSTDAARYGAWFTFDGTSAKVQCLIRILSFSLDNDTNSNLKLAGARSFLLLLNINPKVDDC